MGRERGGGGRHINETGLREKYWADVVVVQLQSA